MKCSKCGSDSANIMIQKYDPATGKKENLMLCMPCARKLGVSMMEGIQEGFPDLSNISDDQLNSVHNFFQGMSEDDKGKINDIIGQIESQVKGMSVSEEDHHDGDEDYSDGYDEDDFDDENANGFMQFMPFPFAQFKTGEKEASAEKNEGGTDSSKSSSKESKTKTRHKNKKKMGKALRKFGENLNDRAKEGRIDRIVGREKEIDRLVQILNRRQKNNPLLIGEPGVGKTAIAEGLAVRIVEKKVPYKLLDTEIIQLDMTAVVAGTQFRGQFEQRMKDIISDAIKHGNVILIIDEVHNIMSAGDSNGAMNAANILKPALAKGDVQIIGATTLEEYRKHIEKDAALERRFQPVIVEEPTVEEAIEIIEGIKSYYEDFHKVVIPTSSVEAAVRLSKRYLPDRFLPDKAIDVLDEAGSRNNLLNKALIEQKKMNDQFEELLKEHDEASAVGNYEKAASLRTDFLRLEEEIKRLSQESQVEVTEDDVAYVVEALSRVPVQKIGEGEARRLIELEDRLHERIIGQDEAVRVVSAAVRRNRSGFRKIKKPSSFILVGPTGVGKTELAKVLAEEVYGTEDALVRLDMSEYMEKHTVSKLIGSPPGYVGYDDGGQLTEIIRRKPYSVILMDEIEKAHPDVFNMLLQILDDGRLTDSRGRTVFFENAIIIMTSNVGTRVGSAGIGFSSEEESKEKSKHYVLGKLKEAFRPEFLNRVDNIAVFDRLSKVDCAKILELQLKEMHANLEAKNMSMEIGADVKGFLLDKGYSEAYGARPMRKEIARHLEDQVAEEYLRRHIVDGDHLKAEVKDGKVVVSKI